MIDKLPSQLFNRESPHIHDLFDEKIFQEKNVQRFHKSAKLVKILFSIGFAIIILKLFKVQILDHEHYVSLAEIQQQQRVDLIAQRGDILDRNGNALVTSANYPSFVTYPKWIPEESKNKIADGLSKIFNKPKFEYTQKLSDERKYVVLEKGVPRIFAQRVRDLNLNYIAEVPYPHRVYNYNALGSQLLGYVNKEYEGKDGIELFFDSLLRGENGEIMLQRVGQTKTAARIDYPHKKPVKGNSVILTIDATMQSIVEEVLERNVTELKALGGIGLIVKVKSGEILAMGQYPLVSPEDISSSEINELKIRAIKDFFEPGSVFKLINAAAAIEYHLVQPDRVFTAGNSYWPQGRKSPIVDSHAEAMYTFQGSFEHSSNIVTAKISDIVGRERFYKMAKSFGLGEQTGIELPKEVQGNITKPLYWTAPTLNSMAMGYEVSVTPMQLLMAYASVANDGILVEPHIIKKIIANDGTIQKETEPRIVRRVVSSETASMLRDFMEGVVLRGTAKDIAIEGIRIGGKTGTAKKNVNGRYPAGKYYGTFAGFFPFENPEYCALVIIDEPHNGKYYAAQTAAPAFKEIVERMSSTLGIPKKHVTTLGIQNSIVGKTSPKNELFSSTHNSYQVREQFSSAIEDSTGKISVPNLLGMSVRQAMRSLSNLKMKFEISGSGIVFQQFPLAGTFVIAGTQIKLICKSEKIASIR